jgi:hypothetical protein
MTCARARVQGTPPVRAGSLPDAQPVRGWCLADQSLLGVLRALRRPALLERLQELLDLLDAEAALAAGGAIRLEVAHIGPPTDGAE